MSFWRGEAEGNYAFCFTLIAACAYDALPSVILSAAPQPCILGDNLKRGTKNPDNVYVTMRHQGIFARHFG